MEGTNIIIIIIIIRRTKPLDNTKTREKKQLRTALGLRGDGAEVEGGGLRVHGEDLVACGG